MDNREMEEPITLIGEDQKIGQLVKFDPRTQSLLVNLAQI
jgi:hypothetical protein